MKVEGYQWKPQCDEQVIHSLSGEVGSIIEVNRYFSWFRVKYANGIVKQYNMLDLDNLAVRLYSEAEQRADKRLAQENSGITHDWD